MIGNSEDILWLYSNKGTQTPKTPLSPGLGFHKMAPIHVTSNWSDGRIL
jgi:hypothetical protein